MIDPRSMSNDATSMYSTWFSMESAGYCERIFPPAFDRPTIGDSDELCEELTEASSSLTMGGCGERGFLLSLRVDMDEGDREGGKEEKEGCRCKPGVELPPLVR